jgi:SAM-dependent methyltransferase
MTYLNDKAHEKYPNCFPKNPVSFDDGHLGGTNTFGDPATYHLPHTWSYLIEKHNIKSMIDVGCGFGYALQFISKLYYNVTTFGIEGSAKVVDLTLCPGKVMCHDYTTGPYVPNCEIDLGWSTEFVEHVEPRYVPNFMATFNKCRRVVITYADVGQTGHHHVNENCESYWIHTFESYGFKYDNHETEQIRSCARNDMEEVRRLHPGNHMFHVVDRSLLFEKI